LFKNWRGIQSRGDAREREPNREDDGKDARATRASSVFAHENEFTNRIDANASSRRRGAH
jgi:hypothetical protein